MVPTHIWVSLIKERLQKEDCISKVKSLLTESLNNSFNHGHHGFVLYLLVIIFVLKKYFIFLLVFVHKYSAGEEKLLPLCFC